MTVAIVQNAEKKIIKLAHEPFVCLTQSNIKSKSCYIAVTALEVLITHTVLNVPPRNKLKKAVTGCYDQGSMN